MKQLVTVPFNVLWILFVAGILAAILFPNNHLMSLFEIWILSAYCFVSLLCLWVMAVALFSRKKKGAVVLAPYGLFGLNSSQIAWQRILLVLHWSGDIFFCTFAGSTYVLRGVFSSPEEREQFLHIARELHRTRGAAWRDEWNGKTFGSND